MQRRTPAKSAHISPPSRTASVVNMGLDEKPRMHRKSLGVTNRVWAVLAFFVLLVLLTRFFSPSAEQPTTAHSQHRLIFNGGADSKPRNYLNVTEDEPNPFAFCPVFGPADDLATKYGSLTLSKTRLHLGSGARVQRVIQKALLGLPVTFSVIGSSGECSWHPIPVLPALPSSFPTPIGS
jgi:hypothetical protein